MLITSSHSNATTTKSSTQPLDISKLQSLPQELQDEILSLTLATPPEITITKNYHLPSGLQISSAIRGKFAHAYYTKTTFVTGHFGGYIQRLRYFAKWLSSLPDRHREWIGKVVMVIEFSSPAVDEEVRKGLVKGMRKNLSKQGVDIGNKEVELWYVRMRGESGRDLGTTRVLEGKEDF